METCLRKSKGVSGDGCGTWGGIGRRFREDRVAIKRGIGGPRTSVAENQKCIAIKIEHYGMRLRKAKDQQVNGG